jgi:hypothetical protein
VVAHPDSTSTSSETRRRTPRSVVAPRGKASLRRSTVLCYDAPRAPAHAERAKAAPPGPLHHRQRGRRAVRLQVANRGRADRGSGTGIR